MKKRLAVIGAGSGGIQTVCHFLSWLDNSWSITSIHDPSVPILGIGESTNPTFTNALEYGLDFHIIEDLNALDATLKFGTKYINWRSHEFTIPLISGTVAIHFDTHKLKNFAFDRLHRIWGDKFKEVQGNVYTVYNQSNNVVVGVNDQHLVFDYVIDCRGFPKSYDNYTVFDNNPVNHGLITNIKTTSSSDWKYTHHTATQDGWMFSLPLQSRDSYGYMFNNKITDVETAKVNFANELKVPLDWLEDKEYKFKSYYCNKIIDGRIIKNGNSAVFFEPMFANSLWLYDQVNRIAHDYIDNRCARTDYNERFRLTAQGIYDTICFFYHGGSEYDTPFWRYAKEYSSDIVAKSKGLERAKEHCRDKWRRQIHDMRAPWSFDTKSLFKIDAHLGYNYFTTEG